MSGGSISEQRNVISMNLNNHLSNYKKDSEAVKSRIIKGHLTSSGNKYSYHVFCVMQIFFMYRTPR